MRVSRGFGRAAHSRQSSVARSSVVDAERKNFLRPPRVVFSRSLPSRSARVAFRPNGVLSTTSSSRSFGHEMRSVVFILSTTGHPAHASARGIPSPSSSGHRLSHCAIRCSQTPQTAVGHAALVGDMARRFRRKSEVFADGAAPVRHGRERGTQAPSPGGRFCPPVGSGRARQRLGRRSPRSACRAPACCHPSDVLRAPASRRPPAFPTRRSMRTGSRSTPADRARGSHGRTGRGCTRSPTGAAQPSTESVHPSPAQRPLAARRRTAAHVSARCMREPHAYGSRPLGSSSHLPRAGERLREVAHPRDTRPGATNSAGDTITAGHRSGHRAAEIFRSELSAPSLGRPAAGPGRGDEPGAGSSRLAKCAGAPTAAPRAAQFGPGGCRGGGGGGGCACGGIDSAPAPSGAKICCDKCDGAHPTERCPWFKKARGRPQPTRLHPVHTPTPPLEARVACARRASGIRTLILQPRASGSSAR